MVWRGENQKAGTTLKVGFAINQNLVIAWYCPSMTRPKPTPSLTTKENQENVCKNDGTCTDPTFLCTRTGYDKCYNDKAIKAHNDLRVKHCADKYTVDVDMAKEMQKLLDNNQRATTEAERSTKYKKCQENFFQAKAGTTDKDVMNMNLATD